MHGTTIFTYLHNGIAEVLLLSEEDVSRPSNKSTHGDIREEMVLLQCHVRQTQIPLRVTRVIDHISNGAATSFQAREPTVGKETPKLVPLPHHP